MAQRGSPVKAMKAKAAPGIPAKKPDDLGLTNKKQDQIGMEEEQELANEDSPGPAAVEEAAKQQPQQDEAAARSKELKAMPIEELKQLVDHLGVERGKKADMIEDVLSKEEEVRARKRERAENIRMVVERKRDELTSISMGDLKQACLASAMAGNLSKQQRIDGLLKHWQENGGIRKGLLQLKYKNREAELVAMPSDALQELCDEAGADTFVKDVMVDRIIWKEMELGKFGPPAPTEPQKKPAPEPKANVDVVASFLADEAARAKKKAEEERTKEREARLAKKKADLQSATVPELKQRLLAKGFPGAGNKEELVATLFAREVEDETLACKKAELKALGKDGLKALLTPKGLEAGGINEMIEKLVKYEEDSAKELKDYQSKVMEQLKKKKDTLELKTGNELREMCVNAGLVAGVSKEDLIQRLLHHAKESGEVDRPISLAKRNARREAVEGLDKLALKSLCAKLRVDPLVKQIQVERLLHHEIEAGLFVEEEENEVTQPASKKPRKN